MNKELHQQEIENSHRKGFGGSDAAMFAAIAEKGLDGISQTYLNRIGEVMGLCDPRPRFVTEAMENGHRFEDWCEKNVFDSSVFLREAFIEQPFANNFTTFAHADYAARTFAETVIYELKFSTMTTQQVVNKYRWQFQWYMMLGASVVSLLHGWGNLDGPQTTSIRIDKDEDAIKKLLNGIWILDKAIDEGWQPKVSDGENLECCPYQVVTAVSRIHELTKRVKEMNEEIEKQKAVVMSYMADNLLSSLSGFDNDENVTVSYVKPTTTASFDSKAYFKAHPVSADDKKAFTVEKEKAGYVSFTAKAPKSDVALG